VSKPFSSKFEPPLFRPRPEVNNSRILRILANSGEFWRILANSGEFWRILAKSDNPDLAFKFGYVDFAPGAINEWNLKARSGVRKGPVTGKFRTVVMASWVE
jgi:hypothetical protein